jgi:methionyl-tRNA formyltransferase
MGTPESALPSLDAILAAGHQVPLVVTQPDRPAGRSKIPVPSAVKVEAVARGLSVIQPSKVRTPEFLETIAAAKPDVLAVVAFGRLLVRPVLSAAPHGAVNLHFSLLPAYRGAAPVQWALARGERETGITTFRIDDGLDTGDLLAQRRIAIDEDERSPELLVRLAKEGAGLLVETLAGLDAGTIAPRPQDGAQATLAPMLTKDDGSWSPAWTAAMLEGRVRGFDPWPGVWASSADQRLRIAAARTVAFATSEAAPGTLLPSPDDGVRLACASGTVASISRVQRAGGKEMTARDALHGRLLGVGDRLGPPVP